MKEYVCGFLLSEDLNQVALIRKNRPEWQAGSLNGIGGKVEHCEDALGAMVREFEEETGVHVGCWRLVCKHEWDTKARVWFFTAVGDVSGLRTLTDEQVGVYQVSSLPTDTISNIPWLVPMAIEALRRGCSYDVCER